MVEYEFSTWSKRGGCVTTHYILNLKQVEIQVVQLKSFGERKGASLSRIPDKVKVKGSDIGNQAFVRDWIEVQSIN